MYFHINLVYIERERDRGYIYIVSHNLSMEDVDN